MTRHQAELFNFLLAFAKEHLYQPSAREIVAHFGKKSNNGLQYSILALRKAGHLRKVPGRQRSYEFLTREPLTLWRELYTEGPDHVDE